MKCQIKDMSHGGACIAPIGGYPPSDQFEVEDVFTSERWQAQVVWRGVGRFGVRLTGKTRGNLEKRKSGFGLRP